jgi:hypothetical protein
MHYLHFRYNAFISRLAQHQVYLML